MPVVWFAGAPHRSSRSFRMGPISRRDPGPAAGILRQPACGAAPMAAACTRYQHDLGPDLVDGLDHLRARQPARDDPAAAVRMLNLQVKHPGEMPSEFTQSMMTLPDCSPRALTAASATRRGRARMAPLAAAGALSGLARETPVDLAMARVSAVRRCRLSVRKGPMVARFRLPPCRARLKPQRTGPDCPNATHGGASLG